VSNEDELSAHLKGIDDALGARYTKTVEDDWRNSVSKTEMGYLHGVTSGIQTQFAASQEKQGYTESPMVVSGGELSEGTNAGTFKVAALTALLRTSDSLTGKLEKVTKTSEDNIAITAADTTYYVCLNYNGGSPTISLSTSSPYDADKRNIPIGKVRKDTSNNVHYISGGFRFQDGIRKSHHRAKTLRELELESGSTIAYSGTNNFTMEAGVVYGGLNRFSLSAYDSATTKFTMLYSDGGDGWTETERNTIDYTHYDDGSGTLATIGNNKYGCHYVYRHIDDSHVYVVLGTDSYTLAEAVLNSVIPPERPAYLDDFGCLIGCIIAPKAGGSFTKVVMVTSQFFSAEVADHSNLSGLDYASSGHTGFAKSGANDNITSMTGLDDDGIPYAKVYGAGNLYFPDYNEADQGATGDGKSIKAYVDNIGSDSGTIVLRHNSGGATTTYQLSTSETIPSNITLEIENGTVLNNDISIRNADYKWTASGSGTSEYYLEAAAGGDPGISEPYVCTEDGSDLTAGTAGSLAAGEWDWADNDTLGYSTVYVRLSDSTDPDGKAEDYVKAGYKLTINGPFKAGLYQVFSGDGKVAGLKKACPEWWKENTTPGTTDMTTAIHTAIDSVVSKGTVKLQSYVYVVSNQATGTDQYAVKVNKSVTVTGLGAYPTIRRNTASAFAMFFVGEPDSNATQITNVTIEGIHFDGDDIQHASSGNTPCDYRNAICLRYSDNITIQNCKFTDVDSAALYSMNTEISGVNVNNSNLFVQNNSFVGTVNTGEYIHAIVLSGVNYATIRGNHFKGCDVSISGSGFYRSFSDAITATYDDDTRTNIPRGGRFWTVADNVCVGGKNLSVYLNGMDVTISGNTCQQGIKTRGLGVTITGNKCESIGIGEGASDVTIQGNIVVGDNKNDSMINVDNDGISAYIDARRYRWTDGGADAPVAADYITMQNINITGNTIKYIGSADGSSNAETSIGIRIYSKSSDANYSEDKPQIANVAISGNTFERHTNAILLINTYIKRVAINGNIFNGYDLVDATPSCSEATYNGTQELISKAVYTQNIQKVDSTISFTNNVIYGFKHIFGERPDGEAFSSGYPPYTITGNHFSCCGDIVSDSYALRRQTHVISGNSDNSFFADITVFTRGFMGVFRDLAADDATPSVAGYNCWQTNASSALNITDFDDGQDGQILYIKGGDGGNTTIVNDNDSINLANGANLVVQNADTLTLICNGGKWYEISRSVN